MPLNHHVPPSRHSPRTPLFAGGSGVFTLTGNRPPSSSKRPQSSGPFIPSLSRRLQPTTEDVGATEGGMFAPRPASSGRLFGRAAPPHSTVPSTAAPRPSTQGSPRQMPGAPKPSPRFKGSVPLESPGTSAAFQRRVVSALHDVLRNQRNPSGTQQQVPPHQAARPNTAPEAHTSPPTHEFNKAEETRESKDNQVKMRWEALNEKLFRSKEQTRSKKLEASFKTEGENKDTPTHNISTDSDTPCESTPCDAIPRGQAPRPPSGKSSGAFTPRSNATASSAGVSQATSRLSSSRPGSASTLSGSIRGNGAPPRGPRPPSAGSHTPCSTYGAVPVRPNSRNGILYANRVLGDCEAEESTRRRQLVAAAEEIHTRLFRGYRADLPDFAPDRVHLASQNPQPTHHYYQPAATSISIATSQEQLRLEGNTAYESSNYISAFALYTRAIQLDRNSEAPLPFTAYLFLNRAAASMGLLNFESAVNDCLEAISRAQDSLSIIPAHLNPMLLLPKAWGRMAKSYAMVGRFEAAKNAYTHAVDKLQDLSVGKLTSDATLLKATQSQLQCFRSELQALPILEQFTNALANEEYSVAWEVLLISSKEAGRRPAMEPFIADPAVTLSRLQLVVGRDPARARHEIGRYYLQVVERMRGCGIPVEASGATGGRSSASTRSKVARPSSAAAMDVGSGVLASALTRHLCDVLVLHAKASLLSGAHFLDVARQKVHQALALRPMYTPASVLLKAVDSFDEKVTEASQWTSVGDYRNALESLAAATRVPFIAVSRLRTSISLQRAEILQEKLHNTPAALSECSQGIAAADGPTVALAKLHAQRSKAYSITGDYTQALRDMETAVFILEKSALFDDDGWAAAGFGSTAGKSNDGMIFELCAEYRLQIDNLRQSEVDDKDAFKAFQRKYTQFRTGSANGPRNSTAGGETGNPFKSGESSSNGRPQTAMPSSKKCPYDTLGIPPHSTIQQVRQKYRQLILKVHPDKVITEDEQVRDAAMNRFKEVTQAYKDLVGEAV